MRIIVGVIINRPHYGWYVGGECNGVQGPGGGSGGEAPPPEAKSFLTFAQSKDRQICPFLLIFGKGQIGRQLEHTKPGYTDDG